MPPRRRNSSQQQQPAQAGAVYGPRSALTSFLREQGITGATASQFRPRTGQRLDTQPPPEQDQDQDQDQDQVDPTAANADAGPSTSSSTATPVTAATTTTAAKKRKLKKPEGVDEDGFRLGGSQLPAPAPKKGRYEHRPVGSFAVCAECGKKFTVSKYTASNPNAEVGGVLCQPCTSESIEERASFPGANSGASTPKRPKVQKKKSQRGVDETLFTPIPTLQQACLALVSQYIHSVEALGDLGPKNLDKVSKIVAKNRALDDLNLKLFLDVGHREIKLYDCTKITDRALASISTFAPHLTHLTLLQCGRLDDDVLTAWSHPLTGFKDLRHLTLYAPYLVRAEKWKEFFEGIGGADEKGEGEGEGVVTKKRPELETFQLRMSSRFNDEALAAFVKHNPHVVHLQLSELGKLTSSSLSLLHPLARSSTTMIAPSSDSDSDSVPILRTLDLSRLGTPQGQVLVDKDLIALLATGLGAGLERLVLDGNALLTERSLTEGVRRYCHRLRELSLSDCDGIKGEGVEAMFTGRWPGEEEEEGQEVGGDEGDVAMKGAEAEEGGQQNGGGAAGDATASTSAAAAAAVVVDGDKDQANNKDGAEASQHGAEPDATATAAAADDDDADEEEDLPLFEPGRPWRSPGLTLLNLHRLTTVNPPTLSALMAHSAHSLEYLNLHSCDELDSNALMETLADKAEKVQVVDLSFVRAVDNFVVQRLLERCGGLRVLFLHGNNRVTSDVPRKRGVHLRGLENAFYSEVPAGVPWEQ